MSVADLRLAFASLEADFPLLIVYLSSKRALDQRYYHDQKNQ